jgi:hypothetical protein
LLASTPLHLKSNFTIMKTHASLLQFLSLFIGSTAFSTPPSSNLLQQRTPSHSTTTSLAAHHNKDISIITKPLLQTLTATAAALAILTSPLSTHTTSQLANADEWGKETEAPTLFTGETVMICKKRGPLGACLETTVRTAQNDNDKALKYFKDPSEEVKRKQERMITTGYEESEGNALIDKLRKQSEDNKEKNDMIVRQKTLLNDQVSCDWCGSV